MKTEIWLFSSNIESTVVNGQKMFQIVNTNVL